MLKLRYKSYSNYHPITQGKKRWRYFDIPNLIVGDRDISGYNETIFVRRKITEET